MRYRELWAAAVALAVAAVTIWILGTDGYPGAINECVGRGECYCEAVRPGRVAQPANSWSNVGFAVVGFGFLVDAGRRRLRGGGPWLRYAGLYGAVGVFLGLGSWLFHGTMRRWGGSFDLLSMYAFIAFAVAFTTARIAGPRPFHAVYWPLLVTAGATAFLVPQRFGKFIFGVLIAVALVAEIAVTNERLRTWAPGPRPAQRSPWFWTGLITFAIAWLLWNFSRDGMALCHDPDSLLQGHAAWHLLAAGSVAAFGIYFSRHTPEAATAAR